MRIDEMEMVAVEVKHDKRKANNWFDERFIRATAEEFIGDNRTCNKSMGWGGSSKY